MAKDDHRRSKGDPESTLRLSHRPPSRPVLFREEGSPDPNDQPGGGGERNWIPWAAALVTILVIVGIIVFLSVFGTSQRPSKSTEPSYAAQLKIEGLKLSQATNFAGSQLVYLDGTIANHGNRTVTAATMRVTFPSSDPSESPQVENVPVQLIRSRQPYVDTVPIRAEPLKPGSSREFRLIFDNISPFWNRQIPAVAVAHVSTAQ